MKDAFYFPHFSNARIDRKLRRVRKDLGLEGYGIYFMLLEVLREQKDFCYPYEDVDLLADEFGTREGKVQVVISNYKLFQINEKGDFFSPKFSEYMIPYLEGKEAKRVAAIKGNHIKYGRLSREEAKKMSNSEILAFDEDWKNKDSRNAIAMRPQNDRNTIAEGSQHDRYASQSKVNEMKVNEMKVNESKEKESKSDSLSFYAFVYFENGECIKVDKNIYLEKFPRNAEGMKMRYSYVRDDQTFNEYLERFFAGKQDFNFEGEEHLHNSFNLFLNTNTPKQKNNSSESKTDSFFTYENPNPNWVNWSFENVPAEERLEYIKWANKYKYN